MEVAHTVDASRAVCFPAARRHRGAGALPAPSRVTLTIAGSTEMRPLLIELTSAFSEHNPNVQFTLSGGGSQIGEQRLASGQVDIAASTAAYPDARNT